MPLGDRLLEVAAAAPRQAKSFGREIPSRGADRAEDEVAEGADRVEDGVRDAADKVSDTVEDMTPGDSDRDGH